MWNIKTLLIRSTTLLEPPPFQEGVKEKGGKDVKAVRRKANLRIVQKRKGAKKTPMGEKCKKNYLFVEKYYYN